MLLHPLGVRRVPIVLVPLLTCFFYESLVWNQTDVAFQQLQPYEVERAIDACPDTKPCIPCGLAKLEHQLNNWEYVGTEDCILKENVHYHAGDFVYIRPDGPPPALYLIGQILRIEEDSDAGYELCVEARLFERYDAVVRISQRDGVHHIATDEVCDLLSSCDEMGSIMHSVA